MTIALVNSDAYTMEVFANKSVKDGLNTTAATNKANPEDGNDYVAVI